MVGLRELGKWAAIFIFAGIVLMFAGDEYGIEVLIKIGQFMGMGGLVSIVIAVLAAGK